MFNHAGYEIVVDSDGKFKATVGDETFYASSLVEVKAEIDEHLKAEAHKVKLSLPVLTSRGLDGVITGINRNSSVLTGVLADVAHYDSLYPPTDAVRKLLSRRMELKRILNEIDKQLEPLALNMNRGYGRLSIAAWNQRMARLQQDYNRVCELAKALETDAS